MSDHNRPGEGPPDVPPEYAEAYRRGYERAYQRAGGAAPPRHEVEQTTRLESLDSAFKPVPPTDPQARPAHRRPEGDDRRRMLAPVLLIVLALLLVLSAYGIGRMFSSGVSDVDTTAPEPDRLMIGEDTASQQPSEAESKQPETDKKKYDGPLDPAAIGAASSTCQSDSSVDAAGRPVSYEPANMYDGDMSTAWRCDGGGVGERVTIDLAGSTAIGEVGLVPGYAKTDARSGADRYAENNRITRVRWLFGDGTSVVQRFDGSPGNRELQTTRIPETAADQVVIEILDSTPGPRDTVAISEVRIGVVAG